MLTLLLLLACDPSGGDVDRTASDSAADAGDSDQGDDSAADDSAADDSAADDSATDDSAADDSATDDSATDDSGEPPQPARHIVIAGDSWSTGSVTPTRTLLEHQGFGGLSVTWEDTAVAGSTAAQWVANDDGKLDALDAALDGAAWGRPPADVLLLYLGGNDYNFALNEGLGWNREAAREQLLDDIQADLETLIDHAQAQRPGLQVVLVDYDYLHFEWFTWLYGFSLDADSTLEYNQGLTGLGARKRALAEADADVHYAHNFGILQHVLGNPVTVPFTLPLVDYPPGFFDAPAVAPDYQPYPGGVRRSDIDPQAIPPESLPGPSVAFSDGIHLNDTGWAVLLENTFNQGLRSLLLGEGWTPTE